MANPATLPISRLIPVNVTLTAQAAQGQALNTLLLLGTSTVIDVVSRMRSYDSLAAVAADFGTSAPEYLAAVLWFEQAPQPTQLYIGRWAKTASAGQLFGGPLTATQQLIATWNAITSGGFLVYENGVPLAVTGLDFASDSTLNGVAGAIQTVLAGLSSSSLVVWDAEYERFEFTSGTTGVGSSISFLASPAGVGSFTFAGQPTAADTITLNGQAVEFVSGTPTGYEVQIGGTLAITLANLLTFLQASVNANITEFTYTVVGDVLYVVAATAGSAGDSLTIAKSSSAITVSGATLAGGGATDISAMLVANNTSGNGAYEANGIAAESAVSAVTIFDSTFGQLWFGLVVLTAADSDHEAIAAYIQGANNKHFYGVTTQEGGVLVPGDTTDIAYVLQQSGYTQTGVQYSSTSPYAVVSLLGRILTTDYSENNSVITLMYKQEPGITPENLNATQIGALEAKNCNVFVAYNNGTAIIEPGVSCSGQFIDTVLIALTLALEIQAAFFNLLYTSTTKIPQTDAGVAQLTSTAASICAQYVANGALAPGTWNAQGFGNLEEGDPLPKGYYIYAPPVATQSESQRAARLSVPIQIAAKLAGAVQEVNCSIIVNQ